ncbi:MAG TPA: hypothetical protein VLH59_03350 [Ignavibacteriaceae bacterium]|nr:hypothetical protein [Ignavibacteriaceae bacterium]
MSWLFGYFGNTERQKITSPDIPLYQFKDSNLILFAGGNNQTCFFKSNSLDSCWAVAGVGLKSSDNVYKILDNMEWDANLLPKQINLSSVNGHFVVIKYSDNELKFFTDELGLREIFIIKLPDGFGFTTRIDWLKYFIKPEIDLKEFGSRWLLQNQISRNSFIKNVKRLVCANATIKNNSLSIKQNLWQPDFNSAADQSLFSLSLIKFLSISDKKFSLSLSGGLDSRLLLSYLAAKKYDQWDSHTFGDPNHPDSKVASDLLISLNRKNEIIDDELPSIDKLIEVVKIYSVQSVVTNPVSSILNLRFYDSLDNLNSVIIDGGFGEIWRRAFANRLLLVGKNSLLKKDSKSVSGFLRYIRADIFTEEALIEMEKGVIEQLDNLFEEMPDAKKISPTIWVDLFSIRSRLTNYYAPEQARVDQHVISFMPLVQKDILQLLFGLNEVEKKNGKLFKELIEQNSIQLTKHPLVKGNITHPFNSSSIGARLQSRIKSMIGLSYQSKQHISFLCSLKEFTGDLVQSSDVQNYEYYDRKKLDKIANNFLSGKSDYNSEVDWFLSFELFRQGISK